MDSFFVSHPSKPILSVDLGFIFLTVVVISTESYKEPKFSSMLDLSGFIWRKFEQHSSGACLPNQFVKNKKKERIHVQ
jgi:hypothetical protein